MSNQFESTFALLLRSEEKGRGGLETLVYAVFLLSVVLSIWQFAQSPIKYRRPVSSAVLSANRRCRERHHKVHRIGAYIYQILMRTPVREVKQAWQTLR